MPNPRESKIQLFVLRKADDSGDVDIETLLTDIRTALEVIDDWDETDRAKVNPVVGQAGVSANTGVLDAATVRVTVATNDTVATDLTAVKTAVEILDDWDAVHDAAISADGPQVMAEAADFDGAALPNAVAEGDAVRPKASLSGVGYMMLVSEDGSQSPYDTINNALNVLEVTPEAQQETTVTLFNAELIDDTANHASGVVNISPYVSKTLLLSVTVSAGSPTDVDLWLEYSADNSTFYGANSATEGVRMVDSNGNSVTVFTVTGAVEEVLEVPVWAKYIRANLTGAGTDGSNTFTVTLELMAHGR